MVYQNCHSVKARETICEWEDPDIEKYKRISDRKMACDVLSIHILSFTYCTEWTDKFRRSGPVRLCFAQAVSDGLTNYRRIHSTLHNTIYTRYNLLGDTEVNS